MSEEDILPGTRWGSKIAQALSEIDCGIICLTPETINRPWVLFESGALSKDLDQSQIYPYLHDVEPHMLEGPLSQFNATKTTRQGTLRLVRCLNRNSDQPVPSDILEETFEMWWGKFEDILKGLGERPSEYPIISTDVSSLGLRFIFESRAPALDKFRKYLMEEISRTERKETACISLVGTSARAFLELGFDGSTLISQAVKRKCDLRIMLPNPVIASLREGLEHRAEGSILDDIFMSFNELKNVDVKREQVRYYGSGPSVFGLSTSEWMLLNPYPAADESHTLFTLIMQNVGVPGDIYSKYKKNHFDDLWENHCHEVPQSHWNGGEALKARLKAKIKELKALIKSTLEPIEKKRSKNK